MSKDCALLDHLALKVSTHLAKCSHLSPVNLLNHVFDSMNRFSRFESHSFTNMINQSLPLWLRFLEQYLE